MTREELLNSKEYAIQCEAIDKWNAYNDEGVEVDYTDGYLDGYLKAKSESDWHEYPADPPEKSGAYLVAFKGINGNIYKYIAYYHKDCGFEGEPIDNIIAWMSAVEYQPKK